MKAMYFKHAVRTLKTLYPEKWKYDDESECLYFCDDWYNCSFGFNKYHFCNHIYEFKFYYPSHTSTVNIYDFDALTEILDVFIDAFYSNLTLDEIRIILKNRHQ